MCVQDFSDSYCEDDGADALSLMQQLSQHNATAYMEAEQLLLGDCKGERVGQLDVRNEKENVMALDRQLGEASALCSPGSLLVCMLKLIKADVIFTYA